MTKKISDPAVKTAFGAYPTAPRKQLMACRKLIIEAADHLLVTNLTETLKWGKPAYLHKFGSTVRLSWSKKNPGCASIYFICNSSLLETFREIYPNVFKYKGKRAVHLPMVSPWRRNS
ncbi:MAG: hypothetical protein ACI8Z1_000100 [Candidatus Azotimanducaceae bacterium]|jgi:hypothetical protein